MKSTVETLSPTRVRLAIEVPFAELEPALKQTYRTIGSRVNVPGFRRGKVPAAVIDQRVGRETVISEAVQQLVPEQYLAAVRQHDVKALGRPTLSLDEVADGEPLRFTAEVDVRPEFKLPDLSGLEVPVDPALVADEAVDEEIDRLRDRFATLKTADRAAMIGDYVQLDLAASVDGQEVPGGTATNVSYEVGSDRLVPGLDEALVGLATGVSSTFTTQLVAGDFAGRDADVAITVRAVKERQLPELDDAFAQLATEFDTLDEVRADLRSRLERMARLGQLYSARDKVVEELLAGADAPAPEGVVREEVEHRLESMKQEFERLGGSLDEYLESENRTAEDLDRELTEAATHAVRLQLVLDVLAEAQQVTVTDDEFGQEVVHRARRAGVEPEKYYERLVQSGSASSVFGEVRRGKALSRLLEVVKIVDTDGNEIQIEDLRSAGGSED